MATNEPTVYVGTRVPASLVTRALSAARAERPAVSRSGAVRLALARLAGMTSEEWLVMEAGRIPDPAQVDLIAGVLGLTPEQTEKAVRIHRLAWTAVRRLLARSA